MKQAVLTNPSLSGFEYGMLEDFQDEIIRITDAAPVEVPRGGHLTLLERKLGHGTPHAHYRRLLRRGGYHVHADVLWVVLMGPENWPLDLYKKWDTGVGFKVLYLFDTMESQLPSIRRLLASAKWDLTITSFSGAIPMLETETQRKWFVIPQGVNLNRFRPAPTDKRVIDFCAYGRRLPRIHDSLISHCQSSGRQYQYTTAGSLMAGTRPTEHYAHYAWHLEHSVFNISWPVELTHPQRVRTFSPITCRWFEAAASGNVIVGKAPSDPGFQALFGANAVLELNPQTPADQLLDFWTQLWSERDDHIRSARVRYDSFSHNWTWERRVRSILKLAALGTDCIGADETKYKPLEPTRAASCTVAQNQI